MKKINKITFFHILIVFIIGCDFPNNNESKECACSIPEIKDIKRERGQGNTSQAWDVGTKGEVDAVVKKAVDAKISISGSYANSNSKIEEVYSEIIGANPQITQKANLYRSVACAYYEIVCQDNSLSEQQKSSKLHEVVAGFEKNIKSILLDEKPSKQEQPRQGLAKPNSKPISEKPSRQESSISSPTAEPGNIEEEPVLVEKPVEKSKKVLNEDIEIKEVELSLTGFEQKGSSAKFYFSLENKSASNSTRQFQVHRNFSSLIDQEGNTYKCQDITLGNGQKKINLIYGTPVKCVVEFNVGAITVTKAAYLKIGSYHSGNFEFTNVSVK